MSETVSSKKTSTERVRAFRERQRALNLYKKSLKKEPKSAKQRLREFRARQKALKNETALALTEPTAQSSIVDNVNNPDLLFVSCGTSIFSQFHMTSVMKISSSKVFGGLQDVYCHESSELKCKMNFGIFLPPQSKETPVPVIYWLSGLTCTEANFTQKAGAQKYATEHGVAIVAPDTSPRGLNIPGEEDSWDFGTGAGFYVDATQEPWKKNYRMFSYITEELPRVIQANFPVIPGNQSIMGHSMGGHGALICALKKPGLYKTVSAFAPISNPMQCPWGKKAFSGYLGGSEGDDHWKEWDSTELVKKYNGPPLDILIDQGTEDSFYEQKQLLPENLLNVAKDSGVPLVLRLQDGYDHSYFFISTFIEDHIRHHAKYLKN